MNGVMFNIDNSYKFRTFPFSSDYKRLYTNVNISQLDGNWLFW